MVEEELTAEAFETSVDVVAGLLERLFPLSELNFDESNGHCSYKLAAVVVVRY